MQQDVYMTTFFATAPKCVFYLRYWELIKLIFLHGLICPHPDWSNQQCTPCTTMCNYVTLLATVRIQSVDLTPQFCISISAVILTCCFTVVYHLLIWHTVLLRHTSCGSYTLVCLCIHAVDIRHCLLRHTSCGSYTLVCLCIHAVNLTQVLPRYNLQMLNLHGTLFCQRFPAVDLTLICLRIPAVNFYTFCFLRPSCCRS